MDTERSSEFAFLGIRSWGNTSDLPYSIPHLVWLKLSETFLGWLRNSTRARKHQTPSGRAFPGKRLRDQINSQPRGVRVWGRSRSR